MQKMCYEVEKKINFQYEKIFLENSPFQRYDKNFYVNLFSKIKKD